MGRIAIVLRENAGANGFHQAGLFGREESNFGNVVYAIQNYFSGGGIPVVFLIQSVEAGIISG